MVGSTMNMHVRITAVDRYSKEFKRLEASMRRLDGAAAGYGRSGDRPGAAIGRMMQEKSQQGAEVAASRKGLGGALAPFGLTPGLLGAGAAGLGLKEAITSAATFESQLVGIRKKAGTTAEETQRIGQDALALATSGEVATSIDEVMAAYDRAAAAGLPIEDLREFAKQSAMAADAFEMSAEQVGNAAAGFRVAFNLDQKGVGHLFDVINTVADSGTASESGIIDFLDRAGASLKLFGMNEEQAAGLGGTLLNLKMPAEVAARAMNTLTSKLLAPGSKKANASLSHIVGDTKKFTKLLKEEPNEALVQFLDYVGKLDKFEASEYLTGFLGQGFSDEVIRLATARAELERVQKIAQDKTLTTGSLGRSYDLQLATMESRWKVFNANLQRFKIDMGTMIVPLTGDFLDDATKAVRELQEMIKGLQTTWETLRSAVNAGKVDIIDPMGTKARGEADTAARETIRKLLEKNPKDRAGGAFAARDMDGAWQGKGLAEARNTLRRRFNETPSEKVEADYQTTQVRGYRSAEAESMQSLKEQFGTYLSSDGQSFRPGTDAQELVDEALGQFAGAVLTAVSVINGATGKPMAPGDLGQSTGRDAIPTPRPDTSFTPPVPIARPPQAEIDPHLASYRQIQAPALAALPPPPMAAFQGPPMPSRAELDAMIAQYRAIQAEPAAILPPPNVDTTAATTNLDALAAASAKAGAPIEATADVNITPAMSKLNLLMARAREVANAINNSLMSPSGGDISGSQFPARVDDQF